MYNDTWQTFHLSNAFDCYTGKPYVKNYNTKKKK